MDRLQKIAVKDRMLKCFHKFITQHFCATEVETEATKCKGSEKILSMSSHTYHAFDTSLTR
jgi:hypothetical protein